MSGPSPFVYVFSRHNPPGPGVRSTPDEITVSVMRSINAIIEAAGPYFMTGSSRFRVPPSEVVGQPRFTAIQLHSLAVFADTRYDRCQCLDYIQRRLAHHTRFLLYLVDKCKYIGGSETRTRVVLAVLVGWMSYYHTRSYRFHFRHLTGLRNVLLAERVRSTPGQRVLCLHRVSLQTIRGPPFDFSTLDLFEQEPTD